MTTINFLIAPDFPPEYFAGWHFLNTRLQRITEKSIHLQMPAGSTEERQLIDSGGVDLIYANPFDASRLIRELNYLPLVRPISHPNEMVITASAAQPYRTLEDLKPGMRVLLTENFDVKLIGLRLLESVDLNEENLQWTQLDTFQSVANQLIKGQAEIGFFLASAYHDLTQFTRDQMTVLMESKINDLSHVLLLHPKHQAQQQEIAAAFLQVSSDAAGKRILEDLGLPNGFEILQQEDAEFMIDLMETLLD
ncbi:PhnD/SsuA/transferrin family substrate-binding protein [Stenoxybacter acetivorans]|uniref:PhnD/SsuA/transferrin family substrate-binding protein n=1 Tax=Stenoxybacter acetivorans TaxID=422441 RepID=UPI0005601313|nr:PhnD/SsuA/transferrin family substrate-binding protein [Stenoxybacter acetivorans]